MSKTKKIKIPSMAEIMVKFKKEQNSKAQRSKHNATALFDALQNTKVFSIVANFNGSGDSGQIDCIEYFDRKENNLVEPEGKVLGSKLEAGHYWNQKTNDFEEKPEREGDFGELVEQICYDRLSAHHAGWEINEGSYGTFKFDVLNRKIDLEFNERVESVRSSSESF